MRECGLPAKENTLPRNGAMVGAPATTGVFVKQEHLATAGRPWLECR